MTDIEEGSNRSGGRAFSCWDADGREEGESLHSKTSRGSKSDLRESFSAEVSGLHARLFALAAVITADPVVAEDALANAYAAAWSRFRQGDVAELDRYLWRSVARAARRAARLHRRPSPELPPVRVSLDPADVAAERDHLAYLLGRLPAKQRAVVSLRYLADFSEADVAQLLGLPLGTVKSRLARAAATLRTEVHDSKRHAEERVGKHSTRGNQHDA